MENVPVFVGLDCHGGSVQVCVVDGEGTVLVNRRVTRGPSTTTTCHWPLR